MRSSSKSDRSASSWEWIRKRAILHEKRDLLLGANDDAFRFMALVQEIRENFGSLTDAEVRDVVLGIVRDLLLDGLIYPADWNDESRAFSPWSSTAEESIGRLVGEYDIETINSRINEIAWFFTTPKGEKWVSSYYDFLEELEPSHHGDSGPEQQWGTRR